MSGSTRPTLRRVLADVGPQRRSAFLAAVATVVEVALATSGPLVLARAVTAIVDGDGRQLGLLAGLLVLLVVGDNVATYVMHRCATRFAQEYLGSLRGRLLDQLFALDLEYFDRERAGRVVSRLTSDVDNLQQFLEQGVVMLLRALLLLSGTVGVLLILSVPLTGVLLSCLLPLVPVVVWYRRRAFPAQLAVREANADLMTHLDESLTGVAVVQAFGLEAPRRAEFVRLAGTVARRRVAGARLNTIYQLGLDLLPLVALGAVLLAGAALVDHDLATLTAVVAATLYVGRLFEPIQQLAELSTLFQSAAASFAKVFQFLDERPGVEDLPDAGPLVPGPGQLTVERVTFRYAPGAPDVLREVDLVLVAGERVALVGGSGAGKSTLAKLLARFHDPSTGRILLDGQDVRRVQQHSLRQRLALIPQDGYLFEGTVADNIALGRPGATRDDVEQACSRLGILEQVRAALPEGLDTPVMPGGGSLSSGQRQLVALARALLVDPEVLILDEATSHLDPATDKVVEAALAELLRQRTSVVIAHRVSTALRADRVVVLEAGRVVQVGSPAALQGDPDGAFVRWATWGAHEASRA